jgi:tetratricopeptide (TPR) repeat protein
MESFRKADLKLGGEPLYQSVLDYLRTQLAPRLVLGNGNTFTSAAGILDMAGWMAHDAGHDETARQHFARALDLSRIGGDRQLTAHVLASRGHLAHYMNEPMSAVRAARRGLEILTGGPLNPELESYLYAVQARVFAGLHDPQEAVRCLLQAEKVLQDPRGEPRSPWISTFDEASLASETARCMRQLGQLGEAKRQAQRVIELRHVTHSRARAFGLLITASILVANGSPDEASAVGTMVLTETGQLGSAIVARQLTELREQLQPYRANVMVAEFLTRRKR